MPVVYEARAIACDTTGVAVTDLGPTPLYVSLNGIAPFQDTGFFFHYYADPIPAVDMAAIEPTGGPDTGGTLITLYSSGLSALGRYQPPASGEARCRWGFWLPTDTVYRETAAVRVGSDHLVCPTLPQGEEATDRMSVAINGLQFVFTPFSVEFYRQPGHVQLVEGLLRGPSSGGTRWTMHDPGARLTGFAHTEAALRFCRWGGTDDTIAEPPDPLVNASDTLVCRAADKGPSFAGPVQVQISLNGLDFSDTGLTFTYYRTPEVTAYSPHGGPIGCMTSAVNGDGSAVVSDEELSAAIAEDDALNAADAAHASSEASPVSVRAATATTPPPAPHHTPRCPCASPIHPSAFHLNAPERD